MLATVRIHGSWRRRTAIVLAATVAVTGAATGVAAAHVTVHMDDPTAGASDVAVIFRTPNEMDNAGTTKLDVFFPTATPLLGVLVQPHPGWTGKATTMKLAKPVTTDDGTITEAVSEVVWTADTAANALQPGQSSDFVVTAGQLPDAKSLTFKALQTYSNGKIVRWIEIQAPGADEPDNPAPSIDLSPAVPDGGAVASGGASGSATPAAASSTQAAAASARAAATTSAPPVASSTTKSTSDSTARTLGILGLIAGLLGIGVAVIAVGRSRRAA